MCGALGKHAGPYLALLTGASHKWAMTNAIVDRKAALNRLWPFGKKRCTILLELRDLAAELGFRPVAGAAFIGVHSYDSETTPIASGRPDARDTERAQEFGRLVREKMQTLHSLDEVLPLQVPGEFPYKDLHRRTDIAPVTDSVLCALCTGLR